ncbi:hypothetical protein Tco_1096806 [Tanacetum coccineum]
MSCGGPALSNCAPAGRPLVIKAIYGPDGGFQCDASSRLKRSIWSDIINEGLDVVRIGISFCNSFLETVSSGDDILFWKVLWQSSVSHLMHAFLRLLHLENDKDCKLSERRKLSNGFWLNGLSFYVDSRDPWRWSLSTNGLFTVNKLSKFIDMHYLIPGGGGLRPIFGSIPVFDEKGVDVP